VLTLVGAQTALLGRGRSLLPILAPRPASPPF
jgi:hypothetical protein